jgi:predicted alpha/beta hydrolase family esterase
MPKKQQLLLINGGSTFDTHDEYINSMKTLVLELNKFRPKKDWKSTFQDKLGDRFDVYEARMPNSNNAQYDEWKMWFEKIIDLLDDDIILVGHSLGGIFLAKYLSENTLSKSIKTLFLIAAPFDDENMGESLGSFHLTESLDKLERQADKIFLYYSKDDVVVPFSHAQKYKEQLPQAILRSFEDKGHFRQESFPELVEDIKNNIVS